MNIVNLFKALPQDLQWEILSEFVGTHVVRNGKLMRKLTGEIQLRLLNTMRCNYGGLYLKFKPAMYNPQYVTRVDCDIETKALLLAKYNMYVFLCTKTVNNNIKMSYRYVIANQPYIVTLDNIVVLPPFVKHSYPSYEHTDKKKGLIEKKVTLYSPKTNYLKN
jgi:hypothetical protein